MNRPGIHVLLVDDPTVILLRDALEKVLASLVRRQSKGGLHTEDISLIEDYRDMIGDLDSLGDMEAGVVA